MVSSQDLAWDGIYLEKGENEEFTPDDVTVPQHYFAMNIGPHLQMLIQALLIEAEMDGPNGRIYADSISTALATHFVNHYSLDSSNELSQLHPIGQHRLGQIIDYIEAHLTEDISLSDLALEAGLSKFHFSRLFKDIVGLPPHQYLTKRRIERAAHDLKQSDLTIAQIAHRFGFTDQSHFTRAFKQVKGITPKRFLQQG